MNLYDANARQIGFVSHVAPFSFAVFRRGSMLY